MIDGSTKDGVNGYIGTGPYVLTDFVTDEYAVFERNENYWGEAPAIRKITVKVIPDNQTRIMALESGEIDLIFGKNMIDADAISQYLDDITDKIEDVILRVYICNVTSIRPESVRFAKLVIRCCEMVKATMEEFPNFKKSKELKQCLIEINRLEEDGDSLYLNSMRTLHTSTTDPVEIIVWRDIFKYLEDCLDACEHTSDIVETVIMKNT